MMNNENTARIFQYALLAAGQEDDPYDRELGPIHLLKYAYLADLDYAKFNNGRTYSGIDWRFHNFGPWSTAAHALIAITMSGISAQEIKRPSKFGEDDFVRWRVEAERDEVATTRAQLPIEVRSSIESYVHRFTSDTAGLLHFVYSTPPMLMAAPGESLDFSCVIHQEKENEPEHVPLLERISKKKRKQLGDRMATLRQDFQRRQAAAAQAHCTFQGRHDAIFEEGVAWLNSLAGKLFPEDGAPVEFEGSVWKSEARRGHGLE